MLKASGKHDERALVIMTDGIDLNSIASLEHVVADAKKNQVRVYTIGIGEPGRLDPVNSVLVLDHSGSMQAPADDADATLQDQALARGGLSFRQHHAIHRAHDLDSVQHSRKHAEAVQQQQVCLDARHSRAGAIG